VRRPGADWSFHLPSRHTIDVSEDGRYVSLGAAGEGSTYRLERVDNSNPDEQVVFLGEEVGRVGGGGWGNENREIRGYPFPEIQTEFERLRVRWLDAGLPEQQFSAWPSGATHEDQLRRIRRRLRSV
jgi:hypothetical protein